ncbi:hypothetical protein K438DRAFT_1785001 [Mycena galopus ATCC 62051]|nr:hypothetical protein K438DRAFT_1785001 [Mycena galopus ATCC 62051]
MLRESADIPAMKQICSNCLQLDPFGILKLYSVRSLSRAPSRCTASCDSGLSTLHESELRGPQRMRAAWGQHEYVNVLRAHEFRERRVGTQIGGTGGTGRHITRMRIESAELVAIGHLGKGVGGVASGTGAGGKGKRKVLHARLVQRDAHADGTRKEKDAYKARQVWVRNGRDVLVHVSQSPSQRGAGTYNDGEGSDLVAQVDGSGKDVGDGETVA